MSISPSLHNLAFHINKSFKITKQIKTTGYVYDINRYLTSPERKKKREKLPCYNIYQSVTIPLLIAVQDKCITILPES